MAYDAPTFYAVDSTLSLLAFAAVCLRFWVRLRVQPTYLGADDWLILGAFVFFLADAANQIVAVSLGVIGGTFVDGVPPERAIVQVKSDYAQVILEKPLYAMIKLSILFFFRRIFSIETTFRRLNSFIIVLIIAWGVAFTLAEIFVCGGDPSVLWNSISPAVLWNSPAKPGGSCVNETWLNLSFALTDVPLDILVVLMPFPYISKLQMRRQHKTGVVVIFSLAMLSTIAAIIRLYFISTAVAQSFGAKGTQQDHGEPPALWSTVEAGVSLIAACLPPVAPLLRKASHVAKAPVLLYRRTLSRTPRMVEGGSAFDDYGMLVLKSERINEKQIVVERQTPAG